MSGKKSRDKGAVFERLIRNYLSERLGIEVVNPAASGFGGGDAQLEEFEVEMKNHTSIRLSEWWRQATEQAHETGKLPVIVHKRIGVADAEHQWVSMDLATFANIVERLDSCGRQWCDR